jgi:Na+/H+-dicarboxylate symporter
MIALLFIMVSTAFSAVVGIVLALNIQPGNFVDASSLIDADEIFKDIKNIFYFGSYRPLTIPS